MWHKLGNEIVQMYVHNQSSCVRLSKNTLKGIEEFMMANKVGIVGNIRIYIFCNKKKFIRNYIIIIRLNFKI